LRYCFTKQSQSAVVPQTEKWVFKCH